MLCSQNVLSSQSDRVVEIESSCRPLWTQKSGGELSSEVLDLQGEVVMTKSAETLRASGEILRPLMNFDSDHRRTTRSPSAAVVASRHPCAP